MNKVKIDLPNGFMPLQTQVAGHQFQTDTNTVGLVFDAKSGCVLKPLGKPVCGERELAFYESLRDTDDIILAQAKHLVPKFHSKEKLLINQREFVFLKLENITHGMLKPCIMDIKVGRRTWDPLASPQKRVLEENKYALCKEELGLCLPGFQMYSLETGCLQHYGKEYGKNLNASEFRNTIAMFLNAQSRKVCQPLVKKLLHQLYSIRNWFKVQRQLHFYASSLLIAYDIAELQQFHGIYEKLHTSSNCSKDSYLNGTKHVPVTSFNTKKNFTIRDCSNKNPFNVRVTMIDFAHVFPADDGQPDNNYLFGLENLIGIIEELL